MTNQNALRLADQTILQLRRNKYVRAVWIVHGFGIVRTPNCDDEVARMIEMGADLVGVFGPDAQRQDLAEAIVETAAGA